MYHWDRENCPLYRVARCPLFRGCLSIEVNGRAVGTFRTVRYRPFHMGVASRLATDIYAAMVTPILYDNFYSLNDSNLKYESYQAYG